MTAATRMAAARKAAAALLASCARIVAMTMVYTAIVLTPAACTALTGFAPTECLAGCYDI
jgi:hypothetical protein